MHACCVLFLCLLIVFHSHVFSAFSSMYSISPHVERRETNGENNYSLSIYKWWAACVAGGVLWVFCSVASSLRINGGLVNINYICCLFSTRQERLCIFVVHYSSLIAPCHLCVRTLEQTRGTEQNRRRVRVYPQHHSILNIYVLYIYTQTAFGWWWHVLQAFCCVWLWPATPFISPPPLPHPAWQADWGCQCISPNFLQTWLRDGILHFIELPTWPVGISLWTFMPIWRHNISDWLWCFCLPPHLPTPFCCWEIPLLTELPLMALPGPITLWWLWHVDLPASTISFSLLSSNFCWWLFILACW